jgi:diguanylate cyclase (GGDEF)-like protein
MEVTGAISDSIVQMIQASTRLSDFLGTVGERFLLVMPHTDSKGAMTTANRMRKKLADMDFDVSGKLIKVTLSIGVADNSDEESIFYDAILKHAEAALQNVVRAGGDGLDIHPPKE